MTQPFADPAVATVYNAFPDAARARLLTLRDMVFDVAGDPAIGPLDECLKWGQPAYLTRSRSGTTLRLGLGKSGDPALFTHCQTTVIPDFQALFPDDFTYDGTRAVHLPLSAPLPPKPLHLLIRSALTYHRRTSS